MDIKTLHFQEVEGVLNGYEEASAGCLTARIWKRKDSKGNLGAFVVTLDSDADQLDGATVYLSSFEDIEEDRRIEEAHEHAKCVAQEMFEKYIKTNFFVNLRNRE